MKNWPRLVISLLLPMLSGVALMAQTYVTPMMGGGQVNAEMVHIDIYYDADANQLHAQVDDSYGTPQLRSLEPGYAFDPAQPYAVLSGKAYNAQYGWNVGGFFSMPPGAAIWIEVIDTSPDLEVFSGSGPFAAYTPILGTAGSPRQWRWSGVMVHNTYAVAAPSLDRYFAEYHIYFGDGVTGARENFTHIDDTTVRLEWTAVPVADPLMFKFGALGETNDAPLQFVNADQFTTNSLAVVNLQYTNAGPYAGQYACCIPMLVLPATTANGGPAPNHAAPGSRLELQLESLTGPQRGSLGFWEPGQTQPQFRLAVGEVGGTNRFIMSENGGVPGADPYGAIQGRHITVNVPGLHCLSFRAIDTSTNGPANGPIHAPSPVYCVYLQAGLSISSLERQPATATATAVFGGQAGKNFFLERTPEPDGAAQWQTVAGPLTGSNCLQTLTDLAAQGPSGFYRLMAR